MADPTGRPTGRDAFPSPSSSPFDGVAGTAPNAAPSPIPATIRGDAGRGPGSGEDPGQAAKAAHLAHRRRLADTPRSARRRYMIAVQMDDGTLREFEHRAPAELFLEDICAAFARGTLIATARGEVAVEDLRPGDLIRTRDSGDQPLRWIASCTLVDSQAQAEAMERAFWPLRIRAEALGRWRPSQDMIVSPRFRVLTNHPSCEALFGSPETLAPAIDLLDGESILQVRPCPELTFYNLMLDRHQIISANGLETETYHPGSYGIASMAPELRAQLPELFPHLEGAFERFGRTVRPILKGFEATALRVS